MSAGGERVTAAAITNPDPETALTSSATRFFMTRQLICTPAQALVSAHRAGGAAARRF
jgi:hypothetical protein